MVARREPGPSLQLRFKRAGLELTDGKVDVVLEAPRVEKLRGVLQRYGEWEYNRLLREGVEGSSADAGASTPTDAGEASRHWEGLRFMAQGQVWC